MYLTLGMLADECGVTPSTVTAHRRLDLIPGPGQVLGKRRLYDRETADVVVTYFKSRKPWARLNKEVTK